jgi:hypothetical protein
MYALHLKAPTYDKALKPTPGAMILREGFSLSHALGFERGHNHFNILRAVFMGHQNSIWHCNGDDIF